MASYKLENVETKKLMSFEGECNFLYMSKPGHPYVHILFRETFNPQKGFSKCRKAGALKPLC